LTYPRVPSFHFLVSFGLVTFPLYVHLYSYHGFLSFSVYHSFSVTFPPLTHTFRYSID